MTSPQPIATWRLGRHVGREVRVFDRLESTNSLGLALQCPITQNIVFRTFVSYDAMRTDGMYVQSYEKLDAGGGLDLSVRF